MTDAGTDVLVAGLGVWAPGCDDVARWAAGEADPAVVRPRSDLFPGAAARRATTLTQLAGHALGAALGAARVPPSEAELLLASVGGELDATFACLRLMLERPPSSSPLRFANSLHSSPLGHLGVALGARGFASAITAPAADVVAMGLVEALARVATGARDVALVIADDSWPHAPCPPLAVAVVLTTAPRAGAGVRGRLGGVARGVATLPPSARAAPLRANPSSGALDLLDAVLAGREGRIGLSRAEDGLPGYVVPFSP